MLEILKRVFGGSHQFASDGIMLMIFGGLGVYLRTIPQRLLRWLIDQTTMSVTVKNDDAAFVWVKEWFLEQEFVSRVRNTELDTRLRGEATALIPAQGRHWFWHNGRPFEVGSYRGEEDLSPRTVRRVEWFVFTTLGRRQTFLKKFVAEIVKAHLRNAGETSSLFIRGGDYWERVDAYRPRLLDSVILKGNEKEELIRDIEKFQASRERYYQLGVPYHRGYLFFGPPGTGKTSVVSALAGRFGMSIYMLNLTEFNDKTLASAMNEIPPDSIVLFEDIDSMRAGKSRDKSTEREKKGSPSAPPEPVNLLGVTLSGLLNVLDGFSAPENVLYVMTTNKIEMLDEALLRPGRIDYKLYFGGVTDQQKTALYRRFFPKASDVEAEWFVETHEANTMAEFQGLLLNLEEQRAFSMEESLPERSPSQK
jgi:chaperone BCS1